MLKRKRKAAKERNKKALIRQQNLSSLIAPKRSKRSFTPLKPRESRFVKLPELEFIHTLPSLETNHQVNASKNVDLYEEWDQDKIDEFARREAVAKAEIARRKTMLAPLYNKGAYEYIGAMPPSIIKNLGRKI